MIVVTLTVPGFARSTAAQSTWAADVALGTSGFVDDATQWYRTSAVSVRRYVAPRVSVGGEWVYMRNGDLLRDLVMTATGNVTFDVLAETSPVQPFVVGGAGMFWGRERFATGDFWASDPAFTAGIGVRGRLARRLHVGAEYRVGWELHQRIAAVAGLTW
jgi:hypothetical protein